jgi:hypothetical protein
LKSSPGILKLIFLLIPFWKRTIKKLYQLKTVPEGEEWRLGLLRKLMDLRRCKTVCVEDSKKISAMLESLCDT